MFLGNGSMCFTQVTSGTRLNYRDRDGVLSVPMVCPVTIKMDGTHKVKGRHDHFIGGGLLQEGLLSSEIADANDLPRRAELKKNHVKYLFKLSSDARMKRYLLFTQGQ